MDGAWNKSDKDPDYMEKRVHAKDAYYSDCWIYSTHTQKWYTPEEFMAGNERVSHYRGREDERQFKIMDPKAGLKDKLAKLKEIQNDIDEFSTRMMDYYEFKKKKK
ncbi:hypothetical protein ADIARSV_3509 [Arcticibacter svalbardensis MN12-7]|uniref:Uncharacterized protein n=2 Tax=Arcticibacter TaxID=1288026 RepID=R9GNA2_9SPHI|nr:hypothetical protein ADIARSV_3509 [Arcticibacter svalbardensis MN12-7]